MRRALQSEWLDSAADRAVSSTELAENLADIARINRLTGATWLLCRAACALLPPETRGCTALDLGTGAADWPPAFTAYTRQRHIRAHVIAADVQPGVLRRAHQLHPSLRVIGADGAALPFLTQSIDVAVCAQTLHHLSPDQAVNMLRELARVTRCGFVVFDLARSRLAVPAAQLLTRALSRNLLTRHDGPLSVRRAYKIGEVRELAARAGLSEAALRLNVVFPFRWLCLYRNHP